MVRSPELTGSFSLPDGSTMVVSDDRVRIAELMFQPSLAPPEFWKEAAGRTAAPNSIQVCVGVTASVSCVATRCCCMTPSLDARRRCRIRSGASSMEAS
jgi:hypothetical protein